MNFYKHYLGDYSRKTAHLTMLQHGAYRLLLDHYYSSLEPLPSDKKVLCRIAKASNRTETQAVMVVVDEFFPLCDDGKRHNFRADQEIKAWLALVDKNREIGKLGGRPKTKNKTKTVSERVPRNNPPQKLDNKSLCSDTLLHGAGEVKVKPNGFLSESLNVKIKTMPIATAPSNEKAEHNRKLLEQLSRGQITEADYRQQYQT